jgi:hypothetical protein
MRKNMFFSHIRFFVLALLCLGLFACEQEPADATIGPTADQIGTAPDNGGSEDTQGWLYWAHDIEFEDTASDVGEYLEADTDDATTDTVADVDELVDDVPDVTPDAGDNVPLCTEGQSYCATGQCSVPDKDCILECVNGQLVEAELCENLCVPGPACQ